MNITTGLLCTAIITTAFSVSPLHADPKSSAPGQVDFGEFTAPENGQFVEVNIQGNLINMVAKLTEDSEPEVARILRGLKSVRVNVIGLNEKNSDEIKGRVKSVRNQLSGAGWERIVTVQDEKEDVGVFIKLKGEEAVEGIVVTVLNGDSEAVFVNIVGDIRPEQIAEDVLNGDSEAVFVNIVGDIRPEQIAEVGERLNIDPLKKLSRELGSH